jgi:hypothetical protein
MPAREGYSLDARSLLLFTDGQFFLNGEPVPVETATRPSCRLADRRRSTPLPACPKKASRCSTTGIAAALLTISDLME